MTGSTIGASFIFYLPKIYKQVLSKTIIKKMAGTIDMQDIRHLNLFERITRVRTRFCFRYNEFVIFAVPKTLVSKAIGQGGKNVKKINEILGKKIKVIASPDGSEDVERFLKDVVSPTSFNEMEIIDDEIVITGGSQNKAALIGRNKRRLLELQKIAKDFFGKGLRVV